MKEGRKNVRVNRGERGADLGMMLHGELAGLVPDLVHEIFLKMKG